MRFNDDVYFFMSQRLLDAKFLEQIQAQQFSDENTLAPSFLIREAQQLKQFKELFATALANLCENKPSTVPFIKSLVDGS
jgi:hypothetical protein